MTEGHDGTLYVSQNGGIFGTSGRSRKLAAPGIQAIEGGSVRYLADGLGAPNDLCFGPDGRLYFTDPRGWARPDDLLYVAATVAEEIQVFDHEGALVERLRCGENSLVTNCCFGGSNGTTLFATDSRGERILAFDLEVAGLPLFPYR